MAQTMLNDTIKVTLEKAEALERHVKTVTMRAESLATTDGDFFKTPVNRQEEAQNHLNSLSAQLSTVAPSSQSRTRRRLKQHSASVHTIQLKVVHLFVKSSSSLCDFLSQRGSFGKGAGARCGRHCCATCTFPKFCSARDGTSVERCQQLRTRLRAALLFDEARARPDRATRECWEPLCMFVQPEA